MLYEITGGIVVLTTTALVLLYVYQSKLLYYPTIPNGSKTEFLDASQYLPSGSFKEVFFKTTDDVNLQAYIARQSKPEEAYTLLFFHGNQYFFLYLIKIGNAGSSILYVFH